MTKDLAYPTVLNMETNELSSKVKQVLKTTGRPKSWAAREINVSYGHFHDVLSGKRNLSEDMAKKLNDLLNKLAAPIAG